MKEQMFAKIAASQVDTETLKNLLDKMPVQKTFKEGLKDFFEKKGLFKHKLCNSLVLGVAFSEYSNQVIDPNSDESMRDFQVAMAILSNTKKLPVVKQGEKNED